MLPIAGSDIVAADTHPKTLQALLGHRDIRVTMNIYSHLYEGAEEAAMEQFERYLASATAPSLPHESPGDMDAGGPNSAPLCDGAYRDRTGDLRLANPTDNPPPPDIDRQNRHD